MTLELDQVTLSLATAVVVMVSGVFFIVETLLRRDEGAGRVWSVAFLGAMLTTLCYLLWAINPAAVWPIAVGNTTFVVGTGCIWLGCRVFNRRRIAIATAAVAVGAVGAFVSVLVAGPHAGSWAGALWMFVCLLVFAVLGGVESVRGDMGAYRVAWGMCVVLGLEALFYVARIGTVVTLGFDSTLFTRWFGTVTASVLTIVLTIVALVVTSVLRADRAAERGPARVAAPVPLGRDDLLPLATFATLLGRVCERAASRHEDLAVLAVRLDDLPQISTAFGSEVARDISETARASIERRAPALALLGEDGPHGLLVAMSASSEPDARREAGIVHRGLLEDLGEVGAGIIPVVAIGLVLSGAGTPLGESAGLPACTTEAMRLITAAREAARRAAADVGTPVLLASAEVSAP